MINKVNPLFVVNIFNQSSLYKASIDGNVETKCVLDFLNIL